MNWLPIVINLLLAIHILVSLLIVLLVLMQRPKNEGLGAAFGGGMTDNLFGAQTSNVLQTVTRWLGGIFFALTLLLSFLYVKQTGQKSTLLERVGGTGAAGASATPAPTTPAPSDSVPPPAAGTAAPTDGAVSDPVTLPTPPVAPAPEGTPAPPVPPATEPAPAPAAPQ